jgi:hypothetical protein
MTFTAFRHSLMAQVRDPALTEYWMRFEALQPRLQQDIITPVTTKLDKFANSFVARRIVGQGRSTLNIAEAVQRGQVVLVKTARGVVGHDTAALIGATLLGLLQMTLGEQANLGAGSRRRVRVLVDEFQVLEGVDFGAMLAELRKFGASFALATQALAHLDALDKTLRPSVMANVDQLFCYAVSAEDARVLERELDGVVEATDLINLDDFTCYARLTVHGRRAPVFSLSLDPPAPLDEAQRAQAEALRQRSQRRIGYEAGAVEMLIAHAAHRRKVVAELHQTQQGQGSRETPRGARRNRQDGGGQQSDTESKAGVAQWRAEAMKEDQRTTESSRVSPANAQAGQDDLAASGGSPARGRTRSHWKRGRRGNRRPNEPPFQSLLLTPGEHGESLAREVEGSDGEDGQEDRGSDDDEGCGDEE